MLPIQDIATIEAVESLIQYKFKSHALIWEALHTKAFAGGSDGNKRLAIIGDSVLSLALAEDWYRGDTNRGHWSSKIQSGVGSNANLDRCGRALGLERFILGDKGKKSVADTIEAILGAIYLDTGNNMARCKDVMDALELIPLEQRLEREFEVEGLLILDKESISPSPPRLTKKRQRPSPEEEARAFKCKKLPKPHSGEVQDSKDNANEHLPELDPEEPMDKLSPTSV